MFKELEMKRMELEREVLEKSIDEYMESQSKGIVNAIVTCFEEGPTKNDGRKIDINQFSSIVFDYGKIMVILMNNKDFAEKIIKAMDDRLDVLNKEFDLMFKVRYGGGTNLLKGIENLKTFRKCISEGGKKMENKKKSFDDLIEVVREEKLAGRIKSCKLESLPDNAQFSTIRFVRGDNRSERETRISRSEGYDYTDIINDILGVGKGSRKKTYSDFVDVATDLYKRGLVGLVLDDTGISIDTNDIGHHFHKHEKQGSIFTHSSILHSHKGIDRIIDFREAIEIAKTFEKEVIEILDLESLQKVKEGATGVLANREKFSVIRDHTKYGGSDTLGISFETKDIVNLPLTVLMGATIKQEREV